MQIINFGPHQAEPIALFQSVAASSVSLGHGSGDVHVYCLHFNADGQIGAHPAGYCQLLLVVQGAGWAAGADGERVALSTGTGAFFERGEVHSKGSDTGMMAIMVQVGELTLR